MNNANNQCQFVGNVGREPELRYTPQGTAVVNFSLAVEKPPRRMQDGRWERPEDPQWVNFTAWGKRAEFINQWITKGAMLLVQASYSTSTSEVDGQTRYYHTFTVQELRVLKWPKRDDSPESGGGEFEEGDGGYQSASDEYDGEFPF
jgi:single-strand DNA-binding protein